MNLRYLFAEQDSGIVTAVTYAYYLYKAINGDTHHKILKNKNYNIWKYTVENTYVLVAREKQYR